MAFNAGAIIASLSLNTTQFLTQLRGATNQLRQTATQMRQAFNGNVQGQINNTGNSARNLGIHFKDLERIVSGILISQAFYRIMNAVEDAAKSVLTFSNNMQMAAISMEYFLGSKERAESFLNVIKDFAAVTPFTTEQAVNMSKRLMAMGFAAENVKGVLGIMTDAAAASGGTAEQMDRIVLALGQMKTNGYIAGQELRQLAEAGIPAYKILQQELGLTTDQLRKIGKLKISGDIGVAAILTGLEKRYKGAAARIAETIPGMWSTIKDDFLLISEQMFKSPYKSLEGFLRKVRDTMEKARKTIRESGIGGLFESMFPPSLHEPIRVIIGGIRSIRTSIVNLAKAITPALLTIGGIFIKLSAMILPPIAAIIRVMTNIAVAALQVIPPLKYLVAAIIGLIVAEVAAKALLFLWRITQLGTICTAVARAVNVLRLAIQGLYITCTKNPIVGIIMLIAGALLYLALSSKTVSTWIDKVMAKLGALAGINTDKILQPDVSTQKATDEFNQRLSDMQKNLKGVGAEAKKTGKKVKDTFTASFDELYQIPEKLGETEDDLEGIGEVADFSMPNMEDLKMPDLSMPTPDDNKDAWNFPWIPENKNNAGPQPPMIPPINPAPATNAISTIETAIERLRRKLQVAGQEVVAFFTKWVIKPIIIPGIDIAIAQLNTLASVATRVAEAFNSIVIKPIVLPAIDLTTTMLDSLRQTASTAATFITTEFPKMLQAAILTIVPMQIELIKGFFTTVGKAIVDGLKTVGAWIADHWKEILIGAVVAIVGVILFIFGGEIIAALGAAFAGIGTAVSAFLGSGLVASATGAISAGFAAILGAIVAALGLILPVIIKYWDEIVNFFSGVWTAITDALTTTWNAIVNFFSGIWNAITGALTTAWNNIVLFFSNTWTTISTALQTAWNAVALFLSNLWTTIVNTLKNAWSTVATFFTNILGSIKSGFVSFGSFLGNLLSTLWKDITTVASAAWKAFVTMISPLVDGITNVFVSMRNTIAGIFDGLWKMIKGALNSVINGINSFINTINGISIEIPSVTIPGIDKKIGGGSIGFPKIPNIPGFATGSIVDKDGLYRLAEGGQDEAVIPLKNSNYMKPFSAAVASDLLELLQGSGDRNDYSSGGRDDRQILYVGTLIADDRSLKELERKMQVIRISEKQRKGEE